MMRTHQENLVTPINMTCYLCNGKQNQTPKLQETLAYKELT